MQNIDFRDNDVSVGSSIVANVLLLLRISVVWGVVSVWGQGYMENLYTFCSVVL